MKINYFIPEPRFINWINGYFRIDEQTVVCSSDMHNIEVLHYLDLLVDELYQKYLVKIKITSHSKKKKNYIYICINPKGLNEKVASNDEGYFLDVSTERIILQAGTLRGVFYGLQTLLQMIEKQGRCIVIKGVKIEDFPFSKVRGVHLYLPGIKDIPFFKRLVKLLASLKYNTIFLEVGGGMYYNKHPEINITWKKLSKIVLQCERKEKELYYFCKAFDYSKDSVHTEVGGGSFISQKVVREIVSFAKNLCFDVIPEIPSFSHSYYLACAHPEIAENKSDPYPDSYCPSNPKTYQLLFDVMEEIIDVFKPKSVHIGHDEAYTLKKCPICKKRTGVELFSKDIIKIHDFLAKKNIKTIMWGDKLLNITTKEKIKQGGVRRIMWYKLDPAFPKPYPMPATYGAIDKIPKDIIIMDWYWTLDKHNVDYFKSKGFSVIFGNFTGYLRIREFPSWKMIGSKSNVLGAEVSTWCPCNEYYMARSGGIFNFLVASGMLWSGYSDSFQREKIIENSKIMNNTRKFLGGKVLDYVWKKRENISGSSLMVTKVTEVKSIQLNKKFNSLIFLHTCNLKKSVHDYYMKFEKAIIGKYIVNYIDGTRCFVPIEYGLNISHYNSRYGKEFDALCYFADPVQIGRKTTYSYEWINLKPQKMIKSIDIHYLDSSLDGSITLLRLTGTK